jgi:hypothetical protein
MSRPQWPDILQPPQPAEVQALLETFWTQLTLLSDLLPRGQFLLAAEQIHALRQTVIQMMLALNGIQRPSTVNLNSYLGESQRIALEKTLLVPATDADAWIGQAVALVVIYRWYAPQLVTKFGLRYPQDQENATWQKLLTTLPTWPQQVTTE